MRLRSIFAGKPWLSYFVGYTVSFILLICYLGQHLTLAPNDADGALILYYIQQFSKGARPFYDFIDAYGPIHWIFPSLFFKMAGEQIFGIRIWLLILKVISIGVTYVLVCRLTNRFYAILSVCWMTLLLGMSWQYFQIAYAFHTALPLILLTWYLLICSPFKNPFINTALAAILTSLLIWSKINTGFFLFAGGMFYLFYLIPIPQNSSKDVDWNRPIYKGLKIIQIIGLLTYGFIFYHFIHNYFDKIYFYYLLGPLLIGLCWTFHRILKSRYVTISRIQVWLLYFITTFLIVVLLLFMMFGWEGGLRYISETMAILSHLDYMIPVPLLGEQGFYKGFNEYFWPQFPWLLTGLFCTWLFVQSDEKGRLVFRRKWEIVQVQVGGLFILATLNTFVMYSRSDEAHIIQAIIPSVPVVFILLFHIEKLIMYRCVVYYKTVFRVAIVMFVGLSALTIGEMPSASDLKLSGSDWNHESFRYLKFRKESNEGYILTKGVSFREWDKMTNAAALYIDSITEDDTEVLILIDNQLLNLLSHTLPVGGRYQYLFYLLRSGLINRESFDTLLPPRILKNLLTNPPKVIVGSVDYPLLLKTVPEFRTLLADRYIKTREFAGIFIYELIENKK